MLGLGLALRPKNCGQLALALTLKALPCNGLEWQGQGQQQVTASIQAHSFAACDSNLYLYFHQIW